MKSYNPSHLAFPCLQDCVARYHRYLWTSDGTARRVPRHRGVCQARMVGGVFPRGDGSDVRRGVCWEKGEMWKCGATSK